MEKKQSWNFKEFPEDKEVTKLMPGFEIQYMLTKDTVPKDTEAVFGHCIFPPKSAHYPHLHKAAEEVVYVIKGRAVNGYINENGYKVETECGAGTASFAQKNQVHWTRNPFDEPLEFVFGYFGAPSLDDSQIVDLKEEIKIENAVPKTKITRWK